MIVKKILNMGLLKTLERRKRPLTQVVQVGWGGGVGGQGTVQLTYYVIKAASRHEI